MLGWQEQNDMVTKAADTFEREFGVIFANPAFPGEQFRINRANSFVSDLYGVQLYTDIRRGDAWLAFAKGTLQELRQNSRRLA